MKYNNFISLGFYCGVAMELERLGIRNTSLPFDWLISADLERVLELIDTNFNEFLFYDNLGQEYNVNPKYYYDEYFQLHFYHDFNGSMSLDDQLQSVKHKYNRRIERLYLLLQQPSCIIRYIFDKSEYDFICHHYADIQEKFRQYNSNNRLFFIIDSRLADSRCNDLGSYIIIKNESNKRLHHFISSYPIFLYYLYKSSNLSVCQVIKNIVRYKKKQFLKRITMEKKSINSNYYHKKQANVIK